MIIKYLDEYNSAKHLLTLNRSSHQRCSIKKGFLKNLAKFIGKHLSQSLFFNKVASLRLATLLKKRLWHRCFPVKFAKFLRTPFYRTPPNDYFWKALWGRDWSFCCNFRCLTCHLHELNVAWNFVESIFLQASIWNCLIISHCGISSLMFFSCNCLASSVHSAILWVISDRLPCFYNLSLGL